MYIWSRYILAFVKKEKRENRQTHQKIKIRKQRRWPATGRKLNPPTQSSLITTLIKIGYLLSYVSDQCVFCNDFKQFLIYLFIYGMYYHQFLVHYIWVEQLKYKEKIINYFIGK